MASAGTDELTGRVIRCILAVHNVPGPGFLENVYRRAMVVELRKQRLAVEAEKQISIYYDGIEVGSHRLDLIIEGKLIVELKTVDAFSKAHYAQVRSYLKATQLDTALLINFSQDRADFRRVSPT